MAFVAIGGTSGYIEGDQPTFSDMAITPGNLYIGEGYGPGGSGSYRLEVDSGTSYINSLSVEDLGVDNLFYANILNSSYEIVANNGLTSHTVTTGMTFYTGTAGASMAITLPAAASKDDGYIAVIVSNATRASTTWISTGATFQGAPSTLTADTPVKLVLTKASGNVWRIIQ